MYATCPKCSSKVSVCDTCNKMQPYKRENCYKCGKKLRDQATGSGGTHYTDYSAIGPIKGDCSVCHSKFKKCGNCNAKNPVGKKNCKKCGAKIADWAEGGAGFNYS